jgi:hypothetical protein
VSRRPGSWIVHLRERAGEVVFGGRVLSS